MIFQDPNDDQKSSASSYQSKCVEHEPLAIKNWKTAIKTLASYIYICVCAQGLHDPAACIYIYRKEKDGCLYWKKNPREKHEIPQLHVCDFDITRPPSYFYIYTKDMRFCIVIIEIKILRCKNMHTKLSKIISIQKGILNINIWKINLHN